MKNKMKKIAINGALLMGEITGIERYAREILNIIDEICEKGLFILVVPKSANNIPQYKNIEVKYYGRFKGTLWIQTNYFYYVIRHSLIPFSFDAIVPFFKPGIATIHDISFKVNHDFFNDGIKGYLAILFREIFYKRCTKKCSTIFTVSNYSKKEICKHYSYDADKIIVTGNGWNHIEKITPNYQLRIEHPEWFYKPFFYSLSSIAKNKNIKWIIETAKLNSEYSFLIAGGIQKHSSNVLENLENVKNIILCGRVSDADSKYLMEQCEAFLFPSLYEGFGIPPLEALACGAKIIISNTTCLPEIYRNSASYIDPYAPCSNLKQLLNKEVNTDKEVIQHYTWRNMALIVYNHLIENLN